MKIVLLPGLDGTGKLFEPFLTETPEGVAPLPLAYPGDEPLGYDDLVPYVLDRLEDDCRILLGESFSGPLAIRLATEYPDRFSHVVLVVTFASRPAAREFAALPWRLLFHRPPSPHFLKITLSGGDMELARRVIEAKHLVAARVMAHRMREILNVDVRDRLRACRARILCLQASRDRLVRPAFGNEIVTLAPNATGRTIPGPHLLLQHSPVACWRAIERFLRQ